MSYLLNGEWNVKLNDGTRAKAIFPGTLDENRIGHSDIGANQWHPDAELGNSDAGFDENAPISTRFTRKYTYEGAAELTRGIDYKPDVNRRVFLKIERARCLNVFIDGQKVEPFVEASISTPQIFEITGMLNGENELKIISDNSYPGLPKSDILYSSAATDETQTNWNGLLGDICIYEEEQCFIRNIRILTSGKETRAIVEIDSTIEANARLVINGEGILDCPLEKDIHINAGNTVFEAELKLAENIRYWDIEEPNLYQVSSVLKVIDENNEIVSMLTKEAGIRAFSSDEYGCLTLNGRRVFLRGETNCCVFPETGYEPTDEDSWTKIMRQYLDYGVNCVRFHSHCPPEAAFSAADKVGILLQVELSNWNPKDSFSTAASRNYYKAELKQIILQYGNHPSFVLLTLGNELFADEEGHKYMDRLINMARSMDSSRLFANGSNVHYGEIGCDQNSDFYASQAWHSFSFRGTSAGSPSSDDPRKDTREPIEIQGYINNQYPNAKTDFSESLRALREEYKKPVFGFETGQYEVLPDFDEIEEFKGVTDPVNYKIIKKKVEEKGILNCWKKYVEATGELSLLCYREETEAAVRTKGLSGTFLLGLQDFPGQGTALVGMLNSHLNPKPFNFANPERFKSFFKDQLPLVLLEKYTYLGGEMLRAQIEVANYGKRDLKGDMQIILKDSDDKEVSKTIITDSIAQMGTVTYIGMLEVKLPVTDSGKKYTIEASFDGSDNTYPVWVYPDKKAVCPDNVYETEILDDRAIEILRNNGRVLLAPQSKRQNFKKSIKGQFSTDFWSVGTFSRQEGGMGQLIDTDHPVFEHFPTEFYTNWQWHLMASEYAVILPTKITPIIRELDSYAFLKNMGQLIEVNCLNGKLMISTMGLKEKKEYPEANALLGCIYEYMAGDCFAPKQSMSPETVKEIVC